MSAESSAGAWSDEATRLQEVRRVHWPSAVSAEFDSPVDSDLVVDHLRHWAQNRPHDVALAFNGCEVTYAEYDELSDRVAGWLHSKGIVDGARVGVMLDNCPQFAILMLAILKAGCVHVPISTMSRGHEFREMLSTVSPKVLFCEPHLISGLDSVHDCSSVEAIVRITVANLLEVAPHHPITSYNFERSEASSFLEWNDIVQHPPVKLPGSGPDDLAALNFTGGSTGLPRACEHTQRQMTYTARSSVLASGESGDARTGAVLNSFPMFWIAGEVFGVLTPLITGETSVILHRWDAGVALDLIARYDVKNYNGAVETYELMLGHPSFETRMVASLSNPRAVSFGRRLDVSLRQRWRSATGFTLREGGYGMTETHTANTVTLGFQTEDRDLSGRGTFIGFPVPNTDMIVVDDRMEPCGAGEVGQILLRGPSVMRGYHGDPTNTSNALVNGWIITGDRGVVDPDGALRYLGRNKEMLKVNGMSVYPREIERVLLTIPGITEACVVGVQDPRRGERPVAFVVSAIAGQSKQAIRQSASQDMSSYKIPQIILVDQIPQTSSGKAARARLKQLANALPVEREGEL